MFTKAAFQKLSVLRHVLVSVTALLVASAIHAAPSGLLNDTGLTLCDDGTGAMVSCTTTVTGNTSALPGQDGRFGRDVANPAKVGGGAAGFDFTPLDVSGNVIALTAPPAVPTSTPRCVKDNVTNLIWEVKTSSGLQNSSHEYAWGSNTGIASCGSSVSPCNTDAYINALNALDLCGETANDWRLPTRRELLSLVHRALSTVLPMIDIDYFDSTQSGPYWSSDTFQPTPTNAWFVRFNSGHPDQGDKGFSTFVRLVRSGP